jgi:hypothetical protein
MSTIIVEAVGTFETSVYLFETTRRNIPEGCHLHNRRQELEILLYPYKTTQTLQMRSFSGS